MSVHRTYSQVAAKAEKVTTKELEQLLAQDDNPTIWPGPRRHSRIAMYATMYSKNSFVGFDFCNHGGYTDHGTVFPRMDCYAAVFHFEKLDRLVKWVRS